MKRVLAVGAALGLIFAAAAPAIAADAPAKFKDCPLLGPMPNYEAQQAPQWYNWDSRTLQIQDDGDNTHEVQATGAVCQQQYAEKQGITDGSALEIIENYAAAMQQVGAEIKNKHDGYVVGHLTKDSKEYWLNVGASRDDGYEIKVIAVEPFKRTLLPPSGKDYRLLGHMPGYVAQPPTAKSFDEYSFPTADGEVKIRGKLYSVDYAEPQKKPERQVTTQEIIENYREALKDLSAEFLRDEGLGAENITARLDDHGQTVYVFVNVSRVVAVEEKPFQMTVQPPTADAMKDKLDKDGHIALYVNFDFAKATLKPDAAPTIAQIVALMKSNPDLKAEIDGHTDGIGGHDYNMKLSKDRAASVVAAVVAGGIDGSRLTSAGFGPDKPIASNDTDEGRAKNRRVELVKAP
jgi:outer membrane protein OmpA-like peptidoglycan-associated protein